MENTSKVSTQSIDHLGLVAGMIEELKIVEVIDRLIPNAKELSHGKAIAAMILNGLGYVNKRLYLTPRFFEKKACGVLLGSEVVPEKINDDSLSRTLDAAYTFGVSKLFTHISAKSVEVLGLECKQLHLDSTSFHVDGIYNSNEEKPEKVIHITHGYSRDHRPELNQVILNLIVENVAGIPLYMQPLSGNINDKEGFGDIVKEHIASLKQAQENALLVADSALYTAQTIQTLAEQQRPFITRVPSTIKEAKALLSSVKNQEFEQIDENYHYFEISSEYAGVNQRWFVIESKAFKAKESKTALKNFEKLFEKEEKRFAKLAKEIFYCEAEAIKSLKALQSSLKASMLHDTQILSIAGYSKPGRPFKEQKPDLFTYCIQGTIQKNETYEQQQIDTSGYFILATTTDLSASDVLREYKSQQRVERGFRFLKSPEFLADAFYLKKPERIEAMLMIMTLCLLVYSALEYTIRKRLKETDTFAYDQLKKPTQNPTARWIFETFYEIQYVTIPQLSQIVLANLKEENSRILNILGERYWGYYNRLEINC